MTEKRPMVIWGSSLHALRLVRVPATKYPYTDIFVFESCQKDSLGFESWRQIERITDENSPIWKFIESMMTLSGESVMGLAAVPENPDKIKG
jgi:hypothetical protein